ncbi:MAG: 8-oxoguanine DNA glycosylase [Oscillospiraceae bacterium]|nr:8-oxoguanine DNA glycosylase [Oscillospiraceae bacterium]
MEQQYILKNEKSFEPKHIFECGQCFRWHLEGNGSYTGVFGNNVMNVYKQGSDVIFTGICEGDIEEIVTKYFDLDYDYEKLKEKLSKIDMHLKSSIEYGNGIRILNQDLWEVIISFIISANNNIPRIKGTIEKISRAYGKKIEWNGKEYYAFPTLEELAEANTEDLRKLGVGFRDVRIYHTIRIIQKKETYLDELKKEKDMDKLMDKLLRFSGVGPKVAACIMLFGLGKKEIFPIDVWVERVMNELYSVTTKKEIEKLAKQKYGLLAGVAQQYLFYYRREQ